MKRSWLVVLLTGLLALAVGSTALAGPKPKKGGGISPLVANWHAISQTGFGVFDDGNARYAHGEGGVQCYFGVAGKDVDLVTYNTGRKLRFKFNPNSVAWQGSSLPQDFTAESDLFGINYWGQYKAMGIGTTAQVQMDLEFYVGRITYELDYSSLAVKRTGENTWLVTSDPLYSVTGLAVTDEADLNVIRRNKQQTFGVVNMPIEFEVTLQ